MVGTINWVLKLRVLFCADEGNIAQGNYAKLRVQVCGSKRLDCCVGCQEVSRCHTRGESEESVACEQGIHNGFEPQGTCHQKSETGVLVDPQTGLMSSKKCWRQVLLTIVLVLQQVIAVACEIIQNTCLHLAGLYFVFKLFE